MNYHKFAYLYDQLMQEAPYEEWISFLLSVIKRHGEQECSILDIGCGTGNIAIPLSKEKFSVTGVDLSEEMLMVANEKVGTENVNVKLFHQDMRSLEGLGEYNVVIAMCDTLNYLETEEDLIDTFKSMYEHLATDGLLIFDVHSIYKIDSVFREQTYTYSSEELAYIWECYEGDHLHSIEHELSFFVQNDSQLYERFNELHKQRTFSIEFYKKTLKLTGFQLLSVTGDFSLTSLPDESERWFFVAKKY